MALAEEEKDALIRLQTRLDESMRGRIDHDGKRVYGFKVLNRYYEGNQHLEQLGLAVPDDLRDFVTLVGWPGTYIDAVEERCDLEGFRLPGKPEADDGLAEVWQANDLDEESQMGHLDSLVFGRSYACVGTNEDDKDTPLITVESPMEMVHEYSPRSRTTTAAARFYVDNSAGEQLRRATLYTPKSTIWLTADGTDWTIDDRDDHNMGRCPVVPLVNRSRSHTRYGLSEMGRIITLTDAAARALTNAQVATELMALPQRWAAAVSQADFTNPETGEQVTAWETYFGRVWATASADAKFGQFSAADLANFTRIVEHYAQLISGITGLPLRYFGQLSTNPPSAEGIRADESRLIKTCERKERSWGSSWERVMRLVRLFQTGKDDPKLASMETLWRDPATPTRAQSADAAVKLYTARIISKRQARRDIGYSSVQIANMELDDKEEAADDPLAQAAAAFRPSAPGQQPGQPQPQPQPRQPGTGQPPAPARTPRRQPVPAA